MAYFESPLDAIDYLKKQHSSYLKQFSSPGELVESLTYAPSAMNHFWENTNLINAYDNNSIIFSKEIHYYGRKGSQIKRLTISAVRFVDEVSIRSLAKQRFTIYDYHCYCITADDAGRKYKQFLFLKFFGSHQEAMKAITDDTKRFPKNATEISDYRRILSSEDFGSKEAFYLVKVEDSDNEIELFYGISVKCLE